MKISYPYNYPRICSWDRNFHKQLIIQNFCFWRQIPSSIVHFCMFCLLINIPRVQHFWRWSHCFWTRKTTHKTCILPIVCCHFPPVWSNIGWKCRVFQACHFVGEPESQMAQHTQVLYETFLNSHVTTLSQVVYWLTRYLCQRVAVYVNASSGNVILRSAWKVFGCPVYVCVCMRAHTHCSLPSSLAVWFIQVFKSHH